MNYCSKCGRKLDASDAFCPACGNRMNNKNTDAKSAQQGGSKEAGKNGSQPNSQPKAQPNPQPVDPNKVQYVYVNKKTGKITNNPHVKTKSEGCLQFIGIALIAVAIVIMMVSGTVLLNNYLNSDSGFDDDYDWWDASSKTEVSSWDVTSEVSSETVSSEPVSSEPVSSEPVSSESSLPEELTAAYLNKKIKGKWTTDIPYKKMTLPGTFEFDGKGNVKCAIKAFLFSKKFEGTYKIHDGGSCSLTLVGIKDYLDDDTMTGDLRFVTDDKMEFTVDDTVWKLNRVE